jgi:3-oxoacyl-[acyl-carrier-protein] synthase II
MNSVKRNPHDVRVVITGLGTINPLGNNVREYWDNLSKGKSGIRLTKNFETNGSPVKIAGEVDMPDLTQYFKEKKMIRRLDRFILFAHVAGTQAVKDAGIDIEKAPHRYGVLIGTGDAGIESHLLNVTRLLQKGMQGISPFYVISSIPNSASGYVAKEFNMQGPNFGISSACATGNHAMGLAATMIKMGMADAIFAGGSEAPVNLLGIGAFSSIFALSERNDSPETASRPFDKDRDGFVLSEGAGVICLEELEHARARRAHIYAEVTGYGMSCDAFDMVAPHPEARGAADSIQNSLKEARLNPEDIDLINAHATSTTLGDKMESGAIERVFQDYCTKVPVQSTKSMVGHLLGAAGSVEAIAAIMALEEGVIHPTINQFNQDPEIRLCVVKKEAREAKVRHILSDAFGFGGQNASIIMSKFEG